MPARRPQVWNVLTLILVSTVLTACQSLEFSHPQTEPANVTSTKTPDTETKPDQRHTPVEKRVEPRKDVINQPVDIKGKLVVGGIETTTFPALKNMKLEARIDTGATTSSLHVTSSHIFERDGERWVSFIIPISGNKEGITVERPLSRVVLIKRKGAESQERPVVVMNVRIGKLERSSEFTLASREGFEFPVLIGRNFLTDEAIVDVSHEYLASEKR